jgi:hypothetical protein
MKRMPKLPLYRENKNKIEIHTCAVEQQKRCNALLRCHPKV